MISCQECKIGIKNRILITGSSGYIGSRLIERLKGNKLLLADKKIGIDITDDFYNKYKRFKPDLIYHLAAQTDLRWCEKNLKNAVQCIKDNIFGTMEICKFKSKIIYTSTAGVYGENIIPTPETAELKADNIYTMTKKFSEEVVGSNNVTLRLANVYGNGGKGVYEKLKSGAKIFGDGKNTRDFIHIDDVLDALVKAQNWENGIYNISTGIETSVNELADILGVKKQYLPAIEEQKRSCLDNSKALKTGWKPTIRLK